MFSNKTERLRRVSFYSLGSAFWGLGKHVDVSLLLDLLLKSMPCLAFRLIFTALVVENASKMP